MTKRIFKYPVSMLDDWWIHMHEGAEILCVQMQYQEPFIWAIVDDSKPFEDRRFHVRTTGEMFTGTEGDYVGTFQNGPLVFHLFEKETKT